MINDGYLIPTNTKKGQLIFSIFEPPDLILFSAGISLSIILLLTNQTVQTIVSIIYLLPALISGFLVLPIPNYHNVLTFLKSMLGFYNKNYQKVYKWKGWCFYESKERK